MNSLNRSVVFMILISLLVFMLAACSEDDKKDNNNLTQAQADAAIQDNAWAIMSVANLVTAQATGAASGNVGELELNEDDFFGLVFGMGKRNIDGFEKMGTFSPLDDDGFFYDGNGCWSIDFDTTDAVEGYALTILAELCFDDWNLLGGPTDNTNNMDYDIDFDFSGAAASTEGSFSFNVGVDRTLVVSGIADYNNSTGNLVLNGSDDQVFSLTVTTPSASQSLSFNHSYTINGVTVVPQADYPTAGDIAFSIGFNADPDIEDYPDFTVSGTLTFDGTSIVGVTFAGYNYSLNLTTGQIN